MTDDQDKPQGTLSTRTLTMPAGDIFGGRVMSQMDTASPLDQPNTATGLSR